LTTYDYSIPRQTKTSNPLGLVTTQKYDEVGNLVEMSDNQNRITQYKYDQRDRKTQIIDAESGTTDYAYYGDGTTRSIVDAASNQTEYFYDAASRLTQEKTANGTRSYTYDDVNNRTKTIDRNGRITTFDYDNLNRVKSETWVNGGKTFTYTYDRNGNILIADDGNIKYEYSYDKTDLVERVNRVKGNEPVVSFAYEYDPVGNLTTVDESVANNLRSTTTYKYDPRNLNTEITQTGVGLTNKEVKFTYDEFGLNTNIQRYVNGQLAVRTTHAYDGFGRLTGIEQKNSAGVVISNSQYDLDVLNRLTTENSNGTNRNFEYDKTDQVKSVTGSSSEGYTYDKNGNRTNAGYVTGVGNRLLSDGVYNYQYDDEGNRTKQTNILTQVVDDYTWDYRNRLTAIVTKDAGGAVIKTVGYEYDVDDQRVGKQLTIDNGQLTTTTRENYYLDRNQIAFVTDDSGNETFHYLYGLNIDQVLAQDAPTGMVWSLADRLGTVDLLTDASGNVVDRRTFDSFGRLLNESNPNVKFRYGYTGREEDKESGLDYYRARYYDPNVGRFISVDPIGFEAGDTNLYRYVGNNSTNATDPTGELAWFAWGVIALAGAAYGAYQNYDYQQSRVNDGKQSTGINYLDVGTSAVVGGVAAPVGVALTIIAPETIPLFSGLGLLSGASSYLQGKDAEARGEYNTASHYYRMGIFDAVGSILGAVHPPTNPPSLQSAMALANSTSASFAGAFASTGISDIFQHFFAMTNGDGGSKYEGSGTYDFQDLEGKPITHQIDHRTSPIEIPNNATTNIQSKKAGYQQVKFEWAEKIMHDGKERTIKWLSRWHTKTPMAPRDESSWVVERQMKGVDGKTIKRPGQPPLKIQQIEAENKVYLKPKEANEKPDPNNPNNWVDLETWDAAKRITDRSKRTLEQNEMLDRGHWSDRENRR
jgi:RHS repeat-associated protein